MERIIVFRETDVDGCGGFADIAVEFKCGVTPEEIGRLEELVEGHKKLSAELGLDYSTEDIVREALAQFAVETGKYDAEPLDHVIIEF